MVNKILLILLSSLLFGVGDLTSKNYEEERKASEQANIESMQEQMDWYQKELNLNPFSWGKKKK